MHPLKDFFDGREQAVEPEPILYLLPAVPAVREISREDVAHALALEKALTFKQILVAMQRASRMYGPEAAEQMTKDALLWEFGPRAIVDLPKVDA
jgi:hypothetical protein